MAKKRRGARRESTNEEIANGILDFLKSSRRVLVVEYKGKRLNAIFGAHDAALCANIPVSGILKLLKIKFIQGPLLRIARSFDGGELKNSIYRMFGAKIGRDVYIAPEAYIDELVPELVSIGDGTIIGLRAAVAAHEFSTRHLRLGRVDIGRQVLVGGFSTVRSGVRIGDNSVVAMNSFVNSDVPANRTVGGVPCCEIKKARHGK